jgi:hypothetical protein
MRVLLVCAAGGGHPGPQDVMFILHAEHEMNCSTAAVRHLASSGVDVYTAVAGAVRRAGEGGSEGWLGKCGTPKGRTCAAQRVEGGAVAGKCGERVWSHYVRRQTV